MSLILDALTRAEQEKRAATATAPDILPRAGAGPAPVATLPWVVLLSGLFLVVLAGLLFWWMGGRYNPSPVVIVPPSADADESASTSAPVSASAPETARASARSSPLASSASALRSSERSETALTHAQLEALEIGGPDDGSASDVAALYATAARVSDPASAAVGASDALPARVATPDAIAPTRPVYAAVPKATSAPESSIDVDAVLAQLRVEEGRGDLAAHPVPLLDSLSKQFRDSVPTLIYRLHDYQSQGRSVVVMNGESLAVGQRTRGVVVREILADSVILEFSGTAFRLRALNSWVNL